MSGSPTRRKWVAVNLGKNTKFLLKTLYIGANNCILLYIICMSVFVFCVLSLNTCTICVWENLCKCVYIFYCMRIKNLKCVYVFKCMLSVRLEGGGVKTDL